MIFNISVSPEKFKSEARILKQANGFLPYTGAYIGAYTYCWNTRIDNGLEFEAPNGLLNYCFSVGNFNSIGERLSVLIGKNHNIKSVDTGALGLLLHNQNLFPENGHGSFNQRGCVLIQNDVWIGEDVTIMPNVIVRNGAVIAKNSHVVSDVPPYAVVGGNPAKVIGYRFPKHIIEKMQKIQWWYWELDKILKHADYFTEDLDEFCRKFYEEANEKYLLYSKRKPDNEDAYFVFVDYYESYSSYPYILESFLDSFIQYHDKKLILFIQDDCDAEGIGDEVIQGIQKLLDEIRNTPEILCKVEWKRGNQKSAEEVFYQCSHFIVTRTYQAVYFSCMADLYGMEIISGVDSTIQFLKKRNIYKE